jgi:hypothetical protein
VLACFSEARWDVPDTHDPYPLLFHTPQALYPPVSTRVARLHTQPPTNTPIPPLLLLTFSKGKFEFVT